MTGSSTSSRIRERRSQPARLLPLGEAAGPRARAAELHDAIPRRAWSCARRRAYGFTSTTASGLRRPACKGTAWWSPWPRGPRSPCSSQSPNKAFRGNATGYFRRVNHGRNDVSSLKRTTWKLGALMAVSACAFAALAGAGAAAPQAPPVNTDEPSITGNARVGEVLQGDRGDWQNAQSFAYPLDAVRSLGRRGRRVRLRADRQRNGHQLSRPRGRPELPAPLPRDRVERRRLDGRCLERDCTRSGRRTCRRRSEKHGAADDLGRRRPSASR